MLKEDKPFKLIMSNYDTTITFEFDHSDVTAEDIMQGIVGCMRGLTWHDEQIMQMCIDYVEEYGNYKVIPENA